MYKVFEDQLDIQVVVDQNLPLQMHRYLNRKIHYLNINFVFFSHTEAFKKN